MQLCLLSPPLLASRLAAEYDVCGRRVNGRYKGEKEEGEREK